MKKLAIWILSIFAIVVAADIAAGLLGRWYTRNHDMGGDYTSFNHMVCDFTEQGLVLGNSVALNSLDTRQMSDSLELDYFNGSYNAQELPFMLTVLKEAVRSDSLRHVILGMRPNELSFTGQGERYNFLMPYYGMGHEAIDEGLRRISPHTRYLLNSNLYRYNTIWFRILLYRFVTPNEVGQKGFIAKPVPPQFPTMKDADFYGEPAPERMAQLDEIMDICRDRGIELTVFFPPMYYRPEGTPAGIRYVDSVCAARGIKVYNDLAHPVFMADSTLFFDNGHLNRHGAQVYTGLFIDRLRRSAGTGSGEDSTEGVPGSGGVVLDEAGH